ncbi:MAG TPA: DsrE family protein [Afifellaceae bacterium]|nr:DsrE family protein [Afifellaceae bacterium]
MKRVMTLIASGMIALALGTAAMAEGKTHKIAVHVNQNDPAVMNIALNNIENVKSYYEEKGDKVIVELVAYGPGLNMFVVGKSPVAERIETMALAIEGLTFSACGNTHRKMSEKAGKDVPLLSEAGVVPSGVVRLVELQEEGYSYVKP